MNFFFFFFFFFFFRSASRSSDLAVILNQEACKALFCVPLPTNYQPSLDGQPSSSTASAESVCLGAIIIGFQAENEVAEQDLRAALLTARHIAVTHHTSLKCLIAEIAPVLSTGNDPNYHPGWGNAGGLLPTPPRVRTRNAARAGAGGSRREHDNSGNPASTYIDNPSQSLDSAEDDTSDEDAYMTESSSGSLILNPIQHALLQTTRRWSLVFPHAPLEKQYQEWRGARMAHVDGAALATLLIYHFTRTLRNIHGTQNAYTTSIADDRESGDVILSIVYPFITATCRWEYLPCIIIIFPLLLALFPRTKRWYSRRRDLVVGVLYILLAWHHIIARAGTGGSAFDASAPSSIWSSKHLKDVDTFSIFDILTKRHQHQRQPLQQQQQQHYLHHYGYSATHALLNSTASLIGIMSSIDSIWISVLSIIVNVRHPWQTLMLLIAAMGNLLVTPELCPGGEGAMMCWLALAAKVMVAQLLFPGIAMYWLEFAARRTFCATPAASYFAWRLEGSKSSARTRGRE